MLIASVATGLRSKIDDYALIGFLETQRRFRKPTFPGDTITVNYEVVKREPSRSRPTMGVINLAISVVNQKGEVVQEGSDVVAVERKAA
jgi:acyl dehydratase